MSSRADRPYSSVRGKPIGDDTVKARNDYLIAYNGISAIMWSAVLSQVIGTIFMRGWGKVFENASDFTRMVQSLAVLEVVHSAAGEGCRVDVSGMLDANDVWQDW